jgi:hypothetical protein
MLSEPNVSETLARMETGVRSGELAPTAAVGQVIEEFIRSLGTSRHLEIDTAAPSPKAIKS